MALFLMSAAHLVASQYVRVITENLPFVGEESRDCKITATNILVIECPDTAFVYNAELFKVTGNRGVDDYSDDYDFAGVHPVVGRETTGDISFVDRSENMVLDLTGATNEQQG